MKETIVGALIIGGLIGGAIFLTNPKTHNPIHQITAAKDMVWMSDDLHMNDQDGNKHVVIKKIRKSNDQKSDQHASKKTFIIKMGSDEQDVEVDVKATLEKLIIESSKALKKKFRIQNISLEVEKPETAKKYGCLSVSVTK